MPTYEYVCDACEHDFELFQQMTDPVKRKCPACGKLKLRRLVGTGAGVIFKGSGFYQTDYRSDSYQKAAAAEKKAANGTPSSNGKDGKKNKADKKPASKTETKAKSGDNAKTGSK